MPVPVLVSSGGAGEVVRPAMPVIRRAKAGKHSHTHWQPFDLNKLIDLALGATFLAFSHFLCVPLRDSSDLSAPESES